MTYNIRNGAVCCQKYLYVLQLFILVIANFVNARTTVPEHSDDKFDFILFTQQWPISSCIDHKETKHGASCNLFKNMTSWTVHGLWPTKNGTRGPHNCDPKWQFDETKILDLEPEMFKYWTNIYADSDRLSLWQHEWVKHGTCAADLPALSTQHRYFNKGLEWVMHYNLLDGLARHHITPSSTQTYSSDQLVAAVRDLYKTEPYIDCYYDEDKKRYLLWQVKLCFNRQLELISCKKSHPELRGTNCPAGHPVYYPDTVIDGDYIYSWKADTATNNKTHCSTPLCKALFLVSALKLVPLV